MRKLIRDGKVAVLYSPDFGAGWSTWGGLEDIIFDPQIVEFVEKQDFDGLTQYMGEKYPNVYLGGMDSLEIAWILEGTRFRINEYDGAESIVEENDMIWMTA